MCYNHHVLVVYLCMAITSSWLHVLHRSITTSGSYMCNIDSSYLLVIACARQGSEDGGRVRLARSEVEAVKHLENKKEEAATPHETYDRCELNRMRARENKTNNVCAVY